MATLTRDLESPDNFFRWAAYAAVGAAMRDNVTFRQGPKTVFPNIYVLLLAQSAMNRKGVPLSIVSNVCRTAKVTKVLQGRTSIQGVIDELARVETIGGVVSKGAQVFLIADELASFFVSDVANIPILTDLYDNRPDWDENLRGRGSKLNIKNLCVSMLSASNESLLREVYTGIAVRGGLLGRTFIVTPEGSKKPNSLMDEQDPNYAPFDVQSLIESISRVKDLKGPAIFTPGAKDAFTNWYVNIYNQYSTKGDINGVMARLHTGVMKLSVIIAAGERYTIEVTEGDMTLAIMECMKLLPNYNVFTMSSGRSTLAQAGADVLNDLFKADGHRVTRADILRMHWSDIEGKLLDELMSTLEQAGIVQCMITNQNTVYSLTERGIQLYKQKSGLNGGLK